MVAPSHALTLCKQLNPVCTGVETYKRVCNVSEAKLYKRGRSESLAMMSQSSIGRFRLNRRGIAADRYRRIADNSSVAA
jgi:hypothetical protein